MLLYEDHAKGEVVHALAFAPDGSALASAAARQTAKEGSAVLRDSAGRLHPLLEHSPNLPVYSIAYSPDGSAVFVGGLFGWKKLTHDGDAWRESGPEKFPPVTSLAMLDERTLVVGTGHRLKTDVATDVAGKLELWDISTGQRRKPHFTDQNGVRVVATCPEKRIVAWATGHHKICVWEIIKPRPYEFFLDRNSPALALSPDGTQLAVAVDYAAKVYPVGKRHPRLELKGHKGTVSAVAFSPDGQTIATGSWDCTVKLWDAASGQERATFRWPVGRVYSLAFAPDGLRLAAGGDLGSVVVWDLE